MAAKKATSKSKSAEVVETTPVRKTTVPPRTSSSSSSSATATAPSSKRPTTEQIAKRAYEIWQSGKGGSQAENWFRAERELRGY